MKDIMIRAVLMFIIFTVICGIIYPASITVIAQVFFKDKANGSIMYLDGKKVGSKYIGQNFNDEKYFWSRPSMSNYKNSKSTNIAINTKEYEDGINDRIKKIEESSNSKQDVPLELVTYSASGLDPNISEESALYQVKRISLNRGIDEERVKNLVKENIIFEGLIGEKIVNVLELNIKLDKLSQ